MAATRTTTCTRGRRRRSLDLGRRRCCTLSSRLAAFGTGSSCLGTGLRNCRSGGGTALEVGRVPARALELKAGRRQLLLESSGSAGRTVCQERIRHFLQHILGKATGLTFVRVNWHGNKALRSGCKVVNYKV
ncbi:MAG: hypothetical protein WCL21_18475 [Mariniphaga sp.]